MPAKKRKSAKSQKKTVKKAPSRLYRSETDRVLAGVSGGLGEFFDIDSTVIRLIFVLLTVFGGSGVLLYIILWLVMPTKSKVQKSADDTMRENATEIKKRAEKLAEDLKFSSKRENTRMVLGVLLLGIGLLILISNMGFFRFFNLERLWPLILVILGIAILTKND